MRRVIAICIAARFIQAGNNRVVIRREFVEFPNGIVQLSGQGANVLVGFRKERVALSYGAGPVP